jgi:hypothetical protein
MKLLIRDHPSVTALANTKPALDGKLAGWHPCNAVVAMEECFG